MSDQNSTTEAVETVEESRYEKLQKILEALLLASELPLPVEQLHRLLAADLGVSKADIREALAQLAVSLEGRAAELQEVASGYRIQVRREYSEWVSRLWQEKPPKLSRALLETLALICYRQPVTRGEIEEVRGTALSQTTMDSLLEAELIAPCGRKESPGRPTLWATTPAFLTKFGLKSLGDLPRRDDLMNDTALMGTAPPRAEPPMADAPGGAPASPEAEFPKG
jgi:segregation and condensation protein B